MRLKAKVILVSALFLWGCSKRDKTADKPDNQQYDDYLTQSENEFLESISIPTPALKDVLGPDGEPLARLSQPLSETIKVAFLKTMITNGLSLCDQKTTKTYADEGENKPEHKGLVYSFGQRDYTGRSFPPNGNALHRKYAVYGTDCSGLMINLLVSAGIAISSKATTSNFETALAAAIANGNLKGIVRLYIEDKMKESEIKSGDFILWPGKHIGLAFIQKDNTLGLIQSNGDPKPSDQTQQDKNIGLKRGVHVIALSKAIHGSNFWGTDYKILRLVQAGDTLKGGLVFSLDKSGKHGLVCAPEDQSTGAIWPTIFTPGTSIDSGMGKINTAAIVAKLGKGSHPAGICDQLILNGYDDWYLPSRDELILMYNLLFSNKMGSFAQGEYCSSSDYDETAMWCQSFLLGTTYKGIKYGAYNTKNTYHVRAIRSF